MKRFMKIPTPLAACLLALACTTAMAQTPATPTAVNARTTTVPSQPNPEELTRFDLDFPGGTPRQLVAAIQKAMGHPLNAIVPDEFADVKLPALKMDHVNVAQLFEALAVVSQKRETVFTGQSNTPMGNGYQVLATSYG